MKRQKNALHQIIYLSQLVEQDDSAMARIVDKALRYNPRHDISGMMIYADGDILQVLEGPEDEVAALFEKIKYDTRHKDVFVVLDGPLLARHFPEWSMGFKKIAQLDRAKFSESRQVFLSTPEAITRRSVPGVAIEVINAFCAWAMVE